jgi:hypothetical protein
MFDDKGPKHWTCLVAVAIAAIFFVWIIHSMLKDGKHKPKKVESFGVMDDDINKVVSFVKQRIQKGYDKRKWKSYSAFKNNQGYYNLYEGTNKKPLYSARVDTEDGMKRYRVFKGIYPVHTEAREVKDGAPHIKGDHNGMNSAVTIRHGRERVDIELQNSQIIIKGLGGMGGRNSLPYPWYYGAPLVYTEDGRSVGVMDYKGDKNKIRGDMTTLPVEIMIPEDQEKHLPLYLQTYALLHEHLSKKKL